MIIRKNRNELDQMRKSGMLVWQILQDLSKMVQEGVTTHDLEVAAEKMMKDAGAKPAFKGYYTPSAGSKYPYVLCTSVNDQIVHGMPSARTKLKKGDIVSIYTGVQLNGYFGDSAVTVPVGEINDSVKKLLEVTKESLELAIDKARPGNRLFDICGTVGQLWFQFQNLVTEPLFLICSSWAYHRGNPKRPGDANKTPRKSFLFCMSN